MCNVQEVGRLKINQDSPVSFRILIGTESSGQEWAGSKNSNMQAWPPSIYSWQKSSAIYSA